MIKRKILNLIIIGYLFIIYGCGAPTIPFTRGAMNTTKGTHRLGYGTSVGGTNFEHDAGSFGNTNTIISSTFPGALHYEYGIFTPLNIGAKTWINLMSLDFGIGPTLYIQPLNLNKFRISIGAESGISGNAYIYKGFNYLLSLHLNIGWSDSWSFLVSRTVRNGFYTTKEDGYDFSGDWITAGEKDYSYYDHYSFAISKKIKNISPMLVLHINDELINVEAGIITQILSKRKK